MSASSDEDYQSAEEREDGGNDMNTTQLSKDLEGACISVKDDSMREPETRHSPSSDNSGNDMRGVTQPGINRTTESALKEALPPDSQDTPTSDSLSSEAVVELTEEEITVRCLT